MPYFLYASFPNSRQRNRAPTVQAKTYQFEANRLDEPLSLASPANLNRTYLILKNLGEDYDFYYIYAQVVAFDPSVIGLFGVVNQTVYDPVNNIIYQKQSDGFGTDWNIVLIQDVGERVEPFQSANLDALENVWVATNSTSPLPKTIIGVDEGRG